jgi:hypothetical protein
MMIDNAQILQGATLCILGDEAQAPAAKKKIMGAGLLI